LKVSFSIRNCEGIVARVWNSKASPPRCTEEVGVCTSLLSRGQGEQPAAQWWFDGDSPLGQALDFLEWPQ